MKVYSRAQEKVAFQALIVSDLHFTERPQDAYRWKVFDWLKEKGKEFGCKNVILLGDIFDKKDRHPAELIGLLMHGLRKLQEFDHIIILKGNHDYLDPDMPFLSFLSEFPNITWIQDVTILDLVKDMPFLFLPHTTAPECLWKEVLSEQEKKAPLVFMHQSLSGCSLENGIPLSNGSTTLSFLQTFFTNAKKIISGDIHVPQEMGGGFFTYVGAPHPIDFGDDFSPRGIHLKIINDEIFLESLPIKTIRKGNIKIQQASDLEQLDIEEGDQVTFSVSFSLKDSFPEISYKLHNFCDSKKAFIKTVSLEDVTINSIQELENTSDLTSDMDFFNAFCASSSVDEQCKKIGLELMS